MWQKALKIFNGYLFMSGIKALAVDKLWPVVVKLFLIVFFAFYMAHVYGMHSDILWYEEFWDMFLNKGVKLKEFIFPPAPQIFPPLVTYGIGYVIFDTVYARFVFMNIIEILLYYGALLYFLKSLKGSISYNDRCVVLAILFIGIAASCFIGLLFAPFSNANNAHFSAFLFSLLLTGTAFRILKDKNNKVYLYVFLFAAGVLSVISSSMILVFYYIPVTLIVFTLFILRFLKKISYFYNKLIILFICNAISVFVGKILDGIVNSHHVLDSYLSLKLSRIAYSADMLKSSIYRIFELGRNDIFFWIVTGGLVICFIYMAIKGIFTVKNVFFRSKSKELDISFVLQLYIFAMLFSLLVVIIFSGYLRDIAGYRYFYSFFMILAVGTFFMLSDKTHVLAARISSVAVLCLFVVASIISFNKMYYGNPFSYKQESELSRCINAFQQGGGYSMPG